MRKINQPTNQKVSLRTQGIPGPLSRAIRAREEKWLAPGLQGFAQMAGIVVKEARGSSVTDVDGNTFLDVIGGIGVNGLGHSHPVYVEAIKKQVEKASVGSFSSEARVTLLEKLAAHRISSVSRAQFYSSGAEAVESAMRLAKAHTQKTEFVSFWGGFHGKTLGVLGQMGSDFKKAYGPYAPGAHLVPFANCYRCPFNTTYPSCGLLCAEYIRKQLKMEMGAGIAGILIEPIQGTAGNVIPPKDFLKTIREIANEFDALLIVDEMITGCGRTGSFWASDYFGVQPDIVCIGKQFGGGFPISAIMSKDSIVSAKPWSIPSGSSSSYGGNPLACAAAAASIGIIDDEGIVENVKRVGEYFLGKLRPMQERYPFIGDVRGLGLMLAIEFVEDKKTKTPMTASKTKHIFNECLKRGLLTMSYTSSFRLQPAMTIDEATIDNVVAILEDVFSSLG